MIKKVTSNDICFSLDSWLHEVLRPGLAESPEGRRMSRTQFVEAVVRAIPTFVRSTIKSADTIAVEETVEEFCREMIECRPDSKYVGTRGSKQVFLRFIVRCVHWRTLAKNRPGISLDEIEWEMVEGQGSASSAVPHDLIELAVGWANKLPPCERMAVVEEIESRPCMCPSKSVHFVRCSRGFLRLRLRAKSAGLLDSPVRARRRRLPRLRRVRRPNIRAVRRLGQRFGCA